MFQLNCHCLVPDSSLKNIHEIQPIGVVKPSTFDQFVTASRSQAGEYVKNSYLILN